MLINFMKIKKVKHNLSLDNVRQDVKTLSVHLLVSSLRLSYTYTEAAVQSATFFG